MERKQLNHFDSSGKAVMVDVAGKDETKRIAVTHGFISMSAEAFLAVREGSVKKGDVLTIYDMCKALDRSMCISGIELLKKDGGKSGLYER